LDDLGIMEDGDNAAGADNGTIGTPLGMKVPADDTGPDVQGGDTESDSTGPPGPKDHPDTANGDWNGNIDSTADSGTRDGTAGGDDTEDADSTTESGTSGSTGGVSDGTAADDNEDVDGTTESGTSDGTEGTADGTAGDDTQDIGGTANSGTSDGTEGTADGAAGDDTGASGGTEESANETKDTTEGGTTTTNGVVFGDGKTDEIYPSAGDNTNIRLVQCSSNNSESEDTEDKTITYFYKVTTAAGYDLDALVDDILPELEFNILKALAASESKVMACYNGRLLETVPRNVHRRLASALRITSDPPDEPLSMDDPESK
jgi:hypothetical protein